MDWECIIFTPFLSVMKSGSAISSIASDDSSSGAFAVAGDCRVRVYLPSKQVSTYEQGNK